MPRLMSVAFTEQAVVERRKTVTRRKGWQFLKPGDHLTLVRKSMGRRRADGTLDPLVRLAEVEVLTVRREPLFHVMGAGELTAEGFPEWESDHDSSGANEFMRRYFAPQGIRPYQDVTRIAWRYLDGRIG